VVILNSGFGSTFGTPEENQATFDSLHVPMAIFVGGKDATDMNKFDAAKINADVDFETITKNIPIFYGSDPDKPHEAGYNDDYGGEWGPIIRAWMSWQLKGDEGATTGKGMFVGKNCGLCNTDWIIQKKNMD
jgi:hypothetical protein